MSSPQLQRQMEPLNTHLGQGCVSLTASISFPESLAPAPDCTCCVRASCPQRQGALAHDPLVKFPHGPTSRRQIPLEERSKRFFQTLLPTCASLSARVAECNSAFENNHEARANLPQPVASSHQAFCYHLPFRIRVPSWPGPGMRLWSTN